MYSTKLYDFYVFFAYHQMTVHCSQSRTLINQRGKLKLSLFSAEIWFLILYPCVFVAKLSLIFPYQFDQILYINQFLASCPLFVPGRSSCKGDSGGPLVAKTNADRMYLYGIVSFGTLDCNGRTPSVAF